MKNKTNQGSTKNNRKTDTKVKSNKTNKNNKNAHSKNSKNTKNNSSNQSASMKSQSNCPPKKEQMKINMNLKAIDNGDIRLNKFISDSGICSRREADRLINEGRVLVNRKKVGVGSRICDTDEVLVNGRLIEHANNNVYIAFNKPIGITTTTESNVKDNIIDFINFPMRIFPIGRLDKPSEGLIFLTNDGDIVNKILRSGNNHEKEYIVEVDKKITDDFIIKMANGVPIDNVVTKKCKVYKESDYVFRIILTEGLNRQIRKMAAYFKYEVTKLKRIRIMNIKLGNLKEGTYRFLTDEEIKEIKSLVRTSSKTEFPS